MRCLLEEEVHIKYSFPTGLSQSHLAEEEIEATAIQFLRVLDSRRDRRI
jgi:hypothetical protein